MRRPAWTARDLLWLVVVAALILALGIERRRHLDESARRDNQAREAIQGLAGEVWRSAGAKVPPGKFAPGQQGFFSRLRDAFNGR